MRPKHLESLNAKTFTSAKAGTQLPGFNANEHDIGIVHLGLGAFHRAHQAVYTNTALAKCGGNWRIMGVNMRSTATANSLSAQDNFYTLFERSSSGTSAHIISSLGQSLALAQDRKRITQQLCAAETKIISLTVTEKAYCLESHKHLLHLLNLQTPEIVHDLKNPEQPQTVPGLLVQALRQRRQNSAGGVSIMSCDNLPNNSRVLRRVLMDFARASNPDICNWIADHVSFPSTMVDRITPRSTSETIDEVWTLTGLYDSVPVQCEAFSQWIIEDDFPFGRPAWEKAGAIFVKDVTPYEDMKLRMLNGAHSLLAYSGHVAGLMTIGECMKNTSLRKLVIRHLEEVRRYLQPLADVDYATYADQLIDRFDNPNISHSAYQIAMDGSQKMPLRIFEPAEDAVNQGIAVKTYAFATAAWFRYLMGLTEEGIAYELRDPKEHIIVQALDGLTDAKTIISALIAVDGLLPSSLFSNKRWVEAVSEAFDLILTYGIFHAAQIVISKAD